MSNTSIKHCLVFLSDPTFSVLTITPISNELKSELLGGALPQGSKWRIYAGMRSISFFPLKALSKLYALSYSIITNNIAIPIISFIIILDKETAENIVTRQISDIENAFLREVDVFASLDKDNTELLRENLNYYKSLEKPFDIRKPERINTGNQIVFVSNYNNRLQWKNIESMVLEKGAKSLIPFRTFALQREKNFQVIGLVVSDESNNITQSSNPNNKVFIFVAVLIFIIAIIILFLIILFASR